MAKFPFYSQLDSMDCGPTCLRMVAKYYGKSFSPHKLREVCSNNRGGSSIGRLSQGAEAIGFKTLMATMSFDRLKDEAPLPAIIHWQQTHFVVVYEITKKQVSVGDPSYGIINYGHDDFIERWVMGRENATTGIVLLVEPGSKFYRDEDEPSKSWTVGTAIEYLKPHTKLILQILLGMCLGSFLQLLLPLITQSLVDKGIANNNINFVGLMILGQVMILFSRLILEIFQSQILLFVGSRIGISILTDFLSKLLKLPISFFSSRTTGDILQRIGDNTKVQAFLTGTALEVIFSAFNLILFGGILLLYNANLFLVYLTGSIIHVFWILIFTRKRREINYRLFDRASKNQNVLLQLVAGIQEIKLYNNEQKKKWEWERAQAKGYKLQIINLRLTQIQQIGSFFITEFKNILITYLTVMAVINGDISLGMMLSIQYILGQLSGPISSFIAFAQTIQDVKISIERLGEIYLHEDEEVETQSVVQPVVSESPIIFKNVSFRYNGSSSDILKNINLQIPNNKVTAIVGSSGSGKSTLLKLLLKLYEPSEGEIRIGDIDFKTIGHRFWRDKCSAVLQDGFIFSDTILQNIVMGDIRVDFNRVDYSCHIANIREFIDSLPLRYNTVIGSEGIGLSQGQKQRILIARAVYKHPEYLIFDEATNSLDMNNERTIVHKLQSYYGSRTVIIVAHRLSTVMSADKIVVMDSGEIVEEGTHTSLISNKKFYYNLVKDQLQISQ